MLTPILKTVIPPTSSIDLLTVDTDSQQALAMQYKVSSLPTVVAFRGGKAIGKFVGARPAAQVTAFLDGLSKV
jgi:thioredoxin 1